MTYEKITREIRPNHCSTMAEYRLGELLKKHSSWSSWRCWHEFLGGVSFRLQPRVEIHRNNPEMSWLEAQFDGGHCVFLEIWLTFNVICSVFATLDASSSLQMRHRDFEPNWLKPSATPNLFWVFYFCHLPLVCILPVLEDCLQDQL